MRKTALRAAVLLSVVILILFVVFVVNQTVQIVLLAEQVHPILADVVLWVLMGVLAICVLVPVVLLFRLPKPLVPPASEESPRFEAHLDALRRRLRTNPTVKTMPLETREEVEEALAVLERHADRFTRGASSQVFMATAVSQNGSLDAFLVLAFQARLIWKIAHVYYQRPTLRDMLYLYANVASTAFIASSLEEIDIAEQLEPVLAATVGTVVAAVPGFTLVVNSIMTGSANAFLTLRVGIITKTYCAALVLPPKGILRRSAAVGAGKMLGSITKDGAGKITGYVVKAPVRKVGDVVQDVGDRVEDGWDWVKRKAKRTRKVDEEPEPA